MADTNKIICRKCFKPIDAEEYLSTIKGKRGIICRECYNARAKERYHIKNPLAPARTFDKDDFHCTKCGELKEPREFTYRRGRRQGICKKCENVRRKESRHLNNPSMEYRVVRTEKYRCSKCGELRTEDDFYFKRSSDDVFEIRMPCKICVANNHKNYLYLKENNLLPGIDFDLYAEYKEAIGKYKICPECGLEKHLSDFVEIRKIAYSINFWSNRYVFCYRQIFSTCADCRNRIYILTDRFILNAY